MPDLFVWWAAGLFGATVLLFAAGVRLYKKSKALAVRAQALDDEEVNLQDSWQEVAKLSELGIRACERGRKMLLLGNVDSRSVN